MFTVNINLHFFTFKFSLYGGKNELSVVPCRWNVWHILYRFPEKSRV